jgi:AraC-like DNA-binding protein
MTAQLAFGPWWLLYTGPIDATEVHAHDTFQIVVHAGRPCVVDAARHPLKGPVVVIEPDHPHAFADHRDHALVVLIDPDSAAGRGLRDRRAEHPPSDELHPVASVVGSLRPENWSRAEETVRRVLEAVCERPVPGRPMWWRHPALDMAIVRSPVDSDAELDLATIASDAGLSSERLAEVFTDELGVRLPSYARWMRLVQAIEYLASGATLESAASSAGYSSSATLVEQFQRMFGLTPIQAVGLGQWLYS